MIVVDTSVWIAALRQPGGAESQILTGLLDADEVALPLPVRVELLAGVARNERSALKRALAGLPVLGISDETWEILEGWSERAANAGERFAVTDLLIGAVANEIGGLVWSLDADFNRMGAAGFVLLYR